jgi:hypothetical protein
MLPTDTGTRGIDLRACLGPDGMARGRASVRPDLNVTRVLRCEPDLATGAVRVSVATGDVSALLDELVHQSSTGAQPHGSNTYLLYSEQLDVRQTVFLRVENESAMNAARFRLIGETPTGAR